MLRKLLLLVLCLLFASAAFACAGESQNLTGWNLVFKRIIDRESFPRVYYFPEDPNTPKDLSLEQWNSMVAGRSGEIETHSEYFLKVKLDNGKYLSFVAKIESPQELTKIGVKEFFPPGEYRAENSAPESPAVSEPAAVQATKPPVSEAAPQPEIHRTPAQPIGNSKSPVYAEAASPSSAPKTEAKDKNEKPASAYQDLAVISAPSEKAKTQIESQPKAPAAPAAKPQPKPEVAAAPVAPVKTEEIKTSEPVQSEQIINAADSADKSEAQVQAPAAQPVNREIDSANEPAPMAPPAGAQTAPEASVPSAQTDPAANKPGPYENWMKTLGLGDKVLYTSETPQATSVLIGLPIDKLIFAIPEYLKQHGWVLLNQEQGDNYADFTTDFRYRDQEVAILIPAQRRGHLEISLLEQDPQQTLLTVKLPVEFMQKVPVMEPGEVGVNGYESSWVPDDYTSRPSAFTSYYREVVSGIVVQAQK